MTKELPFRQILIIHIRIFFAHVLQDLKQYPIVNRILC